MKRINLCALVLAVMLIPDVVEAQACPGDHMGSAGGSFATANAYSQPSISPDPDELYDFIGAGGCAYAKFGPQPPDFCIQNRYPSSAQLAAFWFSTPATQIANGCSFTCGGVSCQVRGGDGLPVELMEFSINE